MRPGGVAVIVTCYNLGRSIQEAVGSVLGQTLPASELIVVDDGSDDLYTLQALAKLERNGHRVERTANRGVSAARNAGVRLTSSALVVNLDGDDMLAPQYIEKLAARLEGDPSLDYVSCAQQGFGESVYTWCPPEPGLPESILRGVVHNSTMFRRSVWEAVGGFDETVRWNEDLDFWTSVLEHGFRGTVIAEPLLHYRVRPDSQYHLAIAKAVNAECMRAFYRKHGYTMAQHAEEMVVGKEAFLLEQFAHHEHVVHQIARSVKELASLRSERDGLIREIESLGCPAIDMGELRRTAPFSPQWGCDRGRPIDRFYIEVFLARHRADVRGRVLEIKDAGYTRLFGDGRVTSSDVLDIDVTNEQATIHADLTRAESIPDDAYDAFILTQTLGLIYDAPAAIREAFRILKPGGVLLCTAPAAGRISYEDRGRDGDFWRFTEGSLRRIFAEAFPVDSFEITAFGNVLAGAAFLFGLADHELTRAELEVSDPDLPLVYGIRAVKPTPGPIGTSPAPARPGGAKPAASADRRASTRVRPPRAVILAYHRVGPGAQPGRRVVSTDTFRAQMSVVRNRCHPIALEALAGAVYERRIPDRAVAVTLDDAYLDVLTEAAPVLLEHGIPATAFLTGQGDRPDREFYWDLLDRVFARDQVLPTELHLPDFGMHRVATGTAPECEDARRRLNEMFYGIAGDGRAILARQLRKWSGLGVNSCGPLPLTAERVGYLGSMPGLTVGAHGRDHLCLPCHDEDVQREDVLANRRRLEEIVGREVTAFAYPYGERDPRTVRVLRELGFTSAVTVDERPVEDGLPRLLLPRCEAPTAGGAAFTAWLEALLAGDR